MHKILLFLVCISLMVPGVAETGYQKHSYSFFGTFDTVITIIGYAKDKATFDAAATEAESLFNQYHKLFDPYHAYEGLNNIYTVNKHAATKPVVVPAPLFHLLQQCSAWQPKLQNTVNIAMGSVLNLWHDAREEADLTPGSAKLPSPAALCDAAKHTDMQSIVLNAEENSVFIADSALQINLGAVAKGYATELVAQQLLKGDMPSFIINAGGNVRTGQPPLDGRKSWGVALQAPDGMIAAKDEESPETLFLHNLSVVTSGDYQRYFTVDGKRYHHIISPKTLMPTHYMRSVTIVTEDSALADILSTALFLMPYEEGLAFLKDWPNVGALWILNDLSIRMTDNMQQYALSFGATAR